MEFITTKDIDRQKWKDLLGHKKATFPFQSPDIFDLYNIAENSSAEVFAVEKNGQYKALVVVSIQKESGIKAFFSRRGIIYGGPVINSDDSKLVEFFLREIQKALKHKVIYVETRNSFDYSQYAAQFEHCGWAYEARLNVQLNIEDLTVDDVLAKMKYNRRREIRISKEQGAVTRLAANVEEVKAFYLILEDLYKERVKLPLPPLSFFTNLFENDSGSIFVVAHEDKIIGGVYCVQNEYMICTFYYAGLRAYHKKIFPTHLAIMAAIGFAIEKQLKLVDFMGAGKPNEAYGVRDFKLQFGGDLVEHGRYNKVFNPFLFKIGQMGLKLLKKL